MKHLKTFEQYNQSVNEEIFGFGKKITDEDIIKYMSSHPSRRKVWAEASKDEDKKKAIMEYLRENPSLVKNDEILMNIHYDDKTKKYVKSEGVSKGNFT